AFAGDFLKGLVAVLAVRLVIAGDNSWAALIAGVAALLGHSYSIFIGFKGGRGVVTGFGATVAATSAAPVLMLIAFGAGAVLVAVTRYVSLGSVVGAAVAGVLMCWLALDTGDPVWAVWGILMGGFI